MSHFQGFLRNFSSSLFSVHIYCFRVLSKSANISVLSRFIATSVIKGILHIIYSMYLKNPLNYVWISTTASLRPRKPVRIPAASIHASPHVRLARSGALPLADCLEARPWVGSLALCPPAHDLSKIYFLAECPQTFGSFVG